jgi:hypothetical protein
MEVLEALQLALQTGRRPTIPSQVEQAHGDFVKVMRQCWTGDPMDRPCFSDLLPRLAACLQVEHSANPPDTLP